MGPPNPYGPADRAEGHWPNVWFSGPRGFDPDMPSSPQASADRCVGECADRRQHGWSANWPKSEIILDSVTKFLVCATALALTGTVSDAPSAAAPSIAERSVAVILNAPAATNAIWPGFSLPDRDWAVQDETGVYLVTKTTPPGSFTPRDGWYFRAEPLPNFTAAFELQYRLGDLRLVAVRAKRTVEETVAMLYHESFHVFQHAWAKSSPPVDYGSIQNVLPAHAASVEVERRVLRDALRAAGADTTLAQQAVAVRARRVAQVTPDFVQAERQAERNEGLAAYVEARSAALAFGKSARTVIDDVSRQLAVSMRTFGGSPDERLIRTRAYGTGAAMGLLLDWLGIDWKARAPSEPLDRLLAESVGPLDPNAADAAYRRYGYERLLDEYPSSWGSLQVMSEGAFDRLGPYRLVLDLPQGAKIGWSLATSATNDSGMHRPSPRILLMPMVRRLTVNHDGVSMEVEQRPVKVVGPENEVARSIVTVLLAEPPGLAGKRVEPGLDATQSDFRLVGRGVTVTITGPARVVAVRDQITISK